MKIPRATRFLGIPALLLASLASPSIPFTAAAPSQIVAINASFTIPASPQTCSVDLAGSAVGFIKSSVDQHGDTVVVTEGIHEHEAFANPANGLSVSFVTNERQTFIFSPGGGLTVVSTGLLGVLTIPGHGAITASVGRLIQTFDQGGTLISTDFQAGQQTGGPFPAVCPYLS
jgi:hypothetical protein